MDDSLRYRKMCLNANELQVCWQPKEGDHFILEGNYCTEEKCEIKICDGCLEMSNKFIIAGNHYDKYFLFSPTLSIRGDGCRLNDTSASILVTDKKYLEDINYKNTHVDEVFWMPRLDQLHNLAVEHRIYVTKEQSAMNEVYKNIGSYIERVGDYYKSGEQLWMGFVMERMFDKVWTGNEWVK